MEWIQWGEDLYELVNTKTHTAFVLKKVTTDSKIAWEVRLRFKLKTIVLETISNLDSAKEYVYDLLTDLQLIETK